MLLPIEINISKEELEVGVRRRRGKWISNDKNGKFLLIVRGVLPFNMRSLFIRFSDCIVWIVVVVVVVVVA